MDSQNVQEIHRSVGTRCVWLECRFRFHDVSSGIQQAGRRRDTPLPVKGVAAFGRRRQHVRGFRGYVLRRR